MGWASGSGILISTWDVVREHIPEEHRVKVLKELMRVFAGHDCDTLDEVIDENWPESEPAYEAWSRSRR